MRSLYLLISGVFIVVCVRDPEVQKIYIKSVRCHNFSRKFIFPNASCFAKSFNRSFSTSTVILTAKKPLFNFTVSSHRFQVSKLFNVNLIRLQVDAQLLFKYGTIYREVLHMEKIEICELTKYATNKLVAQIMDLIMDNAPELIHPCPYKGVRMKHLYVKTSTLISLFPTGDYKLLGQFHLKNQLLFGTTTFLSIDSPNKDTFG